MTHRILTKSAVAAFVLLFALGSCNNQPKQQTVQADALQAQKEQQYQDSLKLAEQAKREAAEREAAEREAAEQERIRKEQEELKSIPVWLNGAFARSYVTMPDRLEDMEQIKEVYSFDRENRTCRLVVYKNNGNDVTRGEEIKFTVKDDIIYIGGTPTLRIYESDFIEPYLAAYNNYQKKYGKVD